MNQDEAENIISSINVVFDNLSSLLEVVNSTGENEFRKNFQRAIGVALTELDMEILEPLYQKFPTLTPDDR